MWHQVINTQTSTLAVPAISPTYIAASLTNQKITLEPSGTTLRLIVMIRGCSHVQIYGWPRAAATSMNTPVCKDQVPATETLAWHVRGMYSSKLLLNSGV